MYWKGCHKSGNGRASVREKNLQGRGNVSELSRGKLEVRENCDNLTQLILISERSIWVCRTHTSLNERVERWLAVS